MREDRAGHRRTRVVRAFADAGHWITRAWRTRPSEIRGASLPSRRSFWNDPTWGQVVATIGGTCVLAVLALVVRSWSQGNLAGAIAEGVRDGTAVLTPVALYFALATLVIAVRIRRLHDGRGIGSPGTQHLFDTGPASLSAAQIRTEGVSHDG